MATIADEEYKKFLEQRLNEVRRELSRLKSRHRELENLSVAIGGRIKGLLIEETQLTNQIKDFTKTSDYIDDKDGSIEKINHNYEEQEKKEQSLNKTKEELIKMRDASSSGYFKRHINRQIKNIDKKLKTLKNSKVRIAASQRRLMLPKLQRDSRRNRLLAQAQGRVNEYEQRMKANEELRDKLSEMKLIGGIARWIYNIRANHYRRRMERALDVLNEMKNSNGIVAIYGARITSLRRTAARRLEEIMPDIGEGVVSVPGR